MAQYPETPIPTLPASIEPEWKTLTSAFDSGREQRRQKWGYAKYNVTLNYDIISADDMKILWGFYQARKGSTESFYFYDLESIDHDSLYVGQGDGSVTTFDIPGKSTSSQGIYINGTPQGDGYTILTGGGSESSDRVQFTTAPALGDIVICDFTGFLRIPCRFLEDKMTRGFFTANLRSTGIKLKGLSFA